MLDQILQPFTYLRIKDGRKCYADWIYPGFCTLVLVFLVWCASPNIDLYGTYGLFAGLTSFVQTLPGFFVAALAVVVALDKPGLDDLLPEPCPTIKEKLNGIPNNIKLTRRRFLCMLFAFLAVESAVLVLLGIFGSSLSHAAKQLLPASIKYWASYTFITIYLFMLFQMLIGLMWGLHYLGSKLLRPQL